MPNLLEAARIREWIEPAASPAMSAMPPKADKSPHRSEMTRRATSRLMRRSKMLLGKPRQHPYYWHSRAGGGGALQSIKFGLVDCSKSLKQLIDTGSDDGGEVGPT
jgi:hypothetical protein